MIALGSSKIRLHKNGEARTKTSWKNSIIMQSREKGSELTDNEADAAVAVQSFSSVVLTCEKPNTNGPLRVAAELGGKVLYLRNFDQSGLSLQEYIAKCHEQT